MRVLLPATIVAAFLASVPVAAEERKGTPPSSRQAARRELQEKLARWRSLPEEQRKELRQRYERFKRLPPEERKRIVRRLEELKKLPPERRRQLDQRLKKLNRRQDRSALERKHERLMNVVRRELKRLSPEARAAIQALPPHRKRERYRQIFEAHLRRNFERRLATLPPEVQEKIRSVPPEKRQEKLRKYLVERRFQRILREVPPAARSALLSLRPRAKRQLLRGFPFLLRERKPEVVRRHLEKFVAREFSKLPPGRRAALVRLLQARIESLHRGLVDRQKKREERRRRRPPRPRHDERRRNAPPLPHHPGF